MANHDMAPVELRGKLTSTAFINLIVSLDDTIIMNGTLSSTINTNRIVSLDQVDFNGIATVSIHDDTLIYIDAYVWMIGVLDSTIDTDGSLFCPDLFVDMKIQSLENTECKKGKGMKITRYKGDTYPITATLGRNGNTNASGISFKMSTQIAGGTVYTADGVVMNAANGVVQFPFPPGSVDIAGDGVYDIQGDDGYIYTYVKGIFKLLDNVTT